MLSSQENVETISRLADELKTFGKLKARSLQLSAVEKLTVVLAAILTCLIVMFVCAFALIWFSAAIALWLAPHVGGTAAAFAIVGIVYLILAVIVILRRKAWIVNPICSFIASVLLTEEGTLSEAEEENN